MASSWGNSWLDAWGNSWGQVTVNPNDMVGSVTFGVTATGTLTAGASPVPSTAGGGGGYRYPRTYWERRKTGQDYSGAAINEILEKAASDVYAELAKKKEIQAQVVEIIRPFTDSSAKKPQVASIDWYAVERDVKATQALLQLWSDQVAGMQEEEDMFAILLLES